MVVFWWILIYTSAVSLFGTVVHRINDRSRIKEDTVEKTRSISLFVAILTFALLLLFVGARSYYNDTETYRYTFIRYITGDLSQIKELWESSSKSKYFFMVEVLFKHYISEDYTVWFFALAIFQIGAIIKIFYNYSSNYFLTSYIFIASTTFTWLMSGIRQFTAVCIILYGLEYLVNRKTIKFLIIVLIASLFHISALLWIPVYFICTVKPWSWKVIVFVFAILGIIVSLDTFTSLLDETLEDTSYAGLTESIQTGEGMNMMRVLVSCVPWVLAFIKRKEIEEEHNLFLDMSVNLSFIASAIYLVATFTSGIIVGRLPIYFTMTNFILLPWIIDRYFTPSFKFLIKLACIVLYLLYFYYNFHTSKNFYESELLGILHHV